MAKKKWRINYFGFIRFKSISGAQNNGHNGHNGHNGNNGHNGHNGNNGHNGQNGHTHGKKKWYGPSYRPSWWNPKDFVGIRQEEFLYEGSNSKSILLFFIFV